MHRLAAGLLCLSVLGGCGAKSPRAYAVPDSHRLEAEIDHAWEAAQRVLLDRGYEIQRIDRGTGVIETGWRTVNADYSAGLFLTENEDRYSDCGKPGLWRLYQGKQARLMLSLLAVGRGQTTFQARAAFRTERSARFFQSSQSVSLLDCHSRGRLEEEIFLETQVKALTDQFQRFRRGGQ